MGVTNQILIGVVGLLIGTLLGNEINRFLYRPKVIIKFKNISPLHSQDGFFLSLVVANYGRTVATNCIGNLSLTDFTREDVMDYKEALTDEALPKYSEEKIDLEFPRHQLVQPNQFREIKNVSLCWSKLGNPCEMNINPGMCQVLDICRVQYNKEKLFWYLIFPSEVGWRKVRLRMKARNIEGRLLVCPENEFPTVLDFKIKLDEQNVPIFIPANYKYLKKIKRFFNRKKIYFD